MSSTGVQRANKKLVLTNYENVAEHLAKHLQQRAANHGWLNDCLTTDKDKSSYFPYRLSENGKADIVQNSFFPKAPISKMPLGGEEQASPSYLINIPMAYSSLKKNPTLLAHLLNLFQNKSFGSTHEESIDFSTRRLAVVIGVNKHKSLDNTLNENFLENIRSFALIHKVPYRVFGFFWEPVWEEIVSNSDLYNVKKAFLLLKVLSPESAEKIILSLEENSPSLRTQIPFQKIRERIKNSDDSRTLAKHFSTQSKKSSIYFGVMDADFQSLQTNNVGIFSTIDQVALQHNNPSAISCGYRVPDNERPLIRLGVKLDMYVRAAMTSIIPYSAYLPEPGSFFCIRRPPDADFLAMTSFLDKGTGLENRRFVQNGRRRKIFDDRVIFLKHGGVVTSTPARMRTKKNESVPSLTQKILKQKSSLQALRDIAQSHATPKQWADNVYVALDFSCPQVTDATTHMMHIFSIFDPISRMYVFSNKRFTVKSFNGTMNNYFAPLTNVQTRILQDAKNELIRLKMPSNMVDLIVRAAKASGEAIYHALVEELGDLG